MSPQEALKRITTPFTSASSGAAASQGVDEASARMGALLSDLAEMPDDGSPELAVASTLQQAHEIQLRDCAKPLSWFFVSDVLALALGMLVAWVGSVLFNEFVLGRGFPSLRELADGQRLLDFGLISAGALARLAYKGHYRIRKPFWMEAQQILSVFAFAMLVDGFVQFAMKEDFSRLWLTSGWVFACLFALLFRHAARALLDRLGLWQVRTLLVGSGATADAARRALRSEPGMGYEIAMQVENVPLLMERSHYSWAALCRRFNADFVVIALDGHALEEAESAIAELAIEEVPFAVCMPHMPVLSLAPQYFFNHDAMLMMPANNLDLPLPRALKRGMDVAVSGVSLFALSPLLVVLALLVKLDGGPVFFGDKRIGRKGKAFACLKFRSMLVDADRILVDYLEKNPEKKKEWIKYHKIRDNDPRVTKVGAFMRKWSLDELPQLINIFRGDMSLVGPRPIMFRERGAYSQDLVTYCKVRPGLTGVWQVSGRNDVSFSRRVQMDGWYVRNWSLWHDIAILFKTVPAILNKRGAY